MKFPVIPKDKLYHFGAGVLAGVVGFLIHRTPHAAALYALIAGVGKEVYDSFNKENHTVDIVDAIVTVTGGVCVAVIVYLIF